MNDRLAALYAGKAIASAADEAAESLATVTDRGQARRAERRSFRAALEQAPGFGIIAEIKHASPSAGIIATDFDPEILAAHYQSAGVDAISVLTEADGFLGKLSYLDLVRKHTTVPLLRKDFLSRPYEIAQASAYGADAILLIVAGLTDAQLSQLLATARSFALDALVEIHTALELDRALAAGADIIGINNRNLRTFRVDLATTETLAPLIPPSCFVVSESGLRTADDVTRARRAGARAVLIGEAAVRSDDRFDYISALRRDSQRT